VIGQPIPFKHLGLASRFESADKEMIDVVAARVHETGQCQLAYVEIAA
jgi:hypothetical protein